MICCFAINQLVPNMLCLFSCVCEQARKGLKESINKKAESAKILRAVASMMETHGTPYSVDPETVEDMSSTEQYELYKCVIAAIEPALQAAEWLQRQQDDEISQLERASIQLTSSAQSRGFKQMQAWESGWDRASNDSSKGKRLTGGSGLDLMGLYGVKGKGRSSSSGSSSRHSEYQFSTSSSDGSFSNSKKKKN